MNHTGHLVGLSLRGEAAGFVALRFRCLLLLLDGGYLYGTSGNGHCRRYRREDIADNGHGGSGAIGVQGICGRLRHCLNNLHHEHFAVGLLLDFGNFLFFLLLGFLDAIGIALCKLYFAVVLFFGLCHFEVGGSPDKLGILLHTGSHHGKDRLGERGKASRPVASVFFRAVKKVLPCLVDVEKLIGMFGA